MADRPLPREWAGVSVPTAAVSGHDVEQPETQPAGVSSCSLLANAAWNELFPVDDNASPSAGPRPARWPAKGFTPNHVLT